MPRTLPLALLRLPDCLVIAVGHMRVSGTGIPGTAGLDLSRAIMQGARAWLLHMA